MKPTQEQPVAWRFRVKADNNMYQKNKWHLRPHRVIDPNAEVQPLYTAPPQREWQGLTKEDIEQIHYGIKCKGMGAYSTNDIYSAIEAKLKEKNT